jgi:hypothetical protein
VVRQAHLCAAHQPPVEGRSLWFDKRIYAPLTNRLSKGWSLWFDKRIYAPLTNRLSKGGP